MATGVTATDETIAARDLEIRLVVRSLGIILAEGASNEAAATALVLAMVVGLSTPSADAVARGSGINRDAMTMQDCKDRLALPRSQRPRSEDPDINLDAICANMLSADRRASKQAPPARRPASATRS